MPCLTSPVFSSSTSHLCPSMHSLLVLLAALGHADLHVPSQVGRDILGKVLKVLAVDFLGEAERSVDNLVVKREEALGDLVGTWVLRVEAGNKDGLLTVVVELEVNGALGEDGALEFVKRAGDLGVLAGADEKAIFKDVAKLEVLSLYEGEELGGARVHMRSVDSTGLEEP
jgi:hypothetical protein